jgi:hypothetical protein
MTIANELIKVITASQKDSARSKQIEVGPSEIGGCRKKVWLKLQGQEKVNSNTLRLSSIMGTAIHSYIQESFHAQDPFGEKFLLEQEFQSDFLKGHVDMYDIENQEVVDWKTTKKSNLTYFPSKQQRWQVQVYGWLLEKNDKPVKNVTLVAIARDGDERDIVYHTEPYDAKIAEEAINWLVEVKEMKEAPAPEKDAFFCKSYCGYYDATGLKGCVGKGKAQAEGAIIEDDEARSAAKNYLQVVSDINELEKKKDSLKGILEGVSGMTPEGIKVTWSEVAGRKSIDEAYVSHFFEKHGEPIQYKHGRTSVRLTVKEG